MDTKKLRCSSPLMISLSDNYIFVILLILIVVVVVAVPLHDPTKKSMNDPFSQRREAGCEGR